MKKMFVALFVAGILIATCRISMAGGGVTVKAGTLGYGGDVTIGLSSCLNLRGGLNVFSYDRDEEMDEATVNGELDFQTIPVLLDWHPWGSGFRISAGPVINNNEILLSASPTTDFELDDQEFDIQGLDGSVAFDDISYYFGIGFGNAACEDGGRIRFAFDFGLLYHGAPDVTATAQATVPALVQNALDAALAAEVQEYEDDLSSFPFWPVISFGFTVAF